MKKEVCSYPPLTGVKSTGAKLACLAAFSLMLSACSVFPVKKSSPSSASAPSSVSSSSVSSSSSAPAAASGQAARAYVAGKQAASQGIVIASTRNACVDSFNFLKGLNQDQFSHYSDDYTRINQNYTFLNVNKEIMDKDSREMLSMTLNKKLDTLCTKVQYAGFIGVKDRIKALNAQ